MYTPAILIPCEGCSNEKRSHVHLGCGGAVVPTAVHKGLCVGDTLAGEPVGCLPYHPQELYLPPSLCPEN